MTHKRPAHTGLERHSQNLAKARSALLEAESDERKAASAVEAARNAVREAHDLGADAADATAALVQAKQDAEQATLAREGIEQRVTRAAAERENYLAENGRALLAELAPDCDQAAEDLRVHAEALLVADKRWRELSTVVAGHLRALHLTPHANSPAGHGLEGIVLDLKRALQSEVISPAPHMFQRDAVEREHERVIAMRRDREGVTV